MNKTKNRVICAIIMNILFFVILIRFVIGNNLLNKEFLQKGLVLIIIFLCVNIFFIQDTIRSFSERRKLKINIEYQKAMEEVIQKYRIAEHEYKNHLNTLSSIVELDGNNSLSNEVDEYVKKLARDNKYSKLKYIDNIIVKAILYNKIKECEENNIEFVYNIKTNMIDCCIQDTELSIVLNNLINNAIEAVYLLEDRRICIDIYFDNKYIINVKNTYNKDKDVDISDIFKKGKSTKGINRGYGLYTVKKIVEKNKGSIEINVDNDYIIFNVIV